MGLALLLALPAAPQADPTRDAAAEPVSTIAAAWPGTPKLHLESAAALVVDESGRPLYAKHTQDQKPIASITKLMTAMVVLDAGVPLDEPLTILESDRDQLRHSRSRLRIDRAATLQRWETLAVALMSSDNRAASALGRTTFPDGKPAFVDAMNRKAAALGMVNTHYADPTGLDGGNRSTAEDLVRLLRAASDYPLITELTSRATMEVQPYGDETRVAYRNTNPLVQDPSWQVELSKTGYVNEAGHCLVMRAVIGGRRLYMVFLDSAGKRTPMGDSNRVRKWLETSRIQLESRHLPGANLGARAGAALRVAKRGAPRMYPGERFNSISHLVGAVLALIGATVLVTLAGVEGSATRIVSFSVYGTTLFLLYLSSTLYHSLRGRAKAVFQVLDHHAIYLLIAGTYTPFTLVALQGKTGWWLFGAVWGLAVFGILIDTLRGEGGRLLSVAIYLLMGWLIVFALGPIIAALPRPASGGWWRAGSSIPWA